MQLKTRNLKSIIKIFILLFGLNLGLQAQVTKDSTLVVTKSDTLATAKIKDSVRAFKRYKADGVAAVVGDFLVLDSDITKMREDAKNQGLSDKEVSNCQLLGRMLENKLYAHEAEQDSTVVVSDAQINSSVDQQIDQFKDQLGGMDKLLAYYRKESEQDLRDELFKINKERALSSQMQEKVADKVEITPEEVREFFDSIPKDERPKFGDEVKIAQLVIEPEVPQEEKQKVIDQLKDMRADIVENGASFATKAVLYSQDGTSSKGGKMSITRDSPLDKDFKQVAFSLREGEVSKPFKSSFGYHIVKVDKIRGQNLDIRHVILIPRVTEATVKEARKKIDSIRQLIEDGKMSFDEAARTMSDEEETRGDGGQLINPSTGDTRFELTKVDPLIYDQVVNLKEDEVSLVLTDQNRTGQKFFKIITVTDRYAEHIADYSQDYSKIKGLALRQKQYRAIRKWQDEHIKDTYVKVNGKYKECTFEGKWLK